MHDFKRFPELTNAQMDEFYLASPHKQIFEDFDAKVVKVIDGDTISVKWAERNFDFPVRFLNLAAPELNEKGGMKSRSWLEKEILGKEVTIQINTSNRVEKWGRLLGNVLFLGLDMGELSIFNGHAVSWANRKEGIVVPDINKELDLIVKSI